MVWIENCGQTLGFWACRRDRRRCGQQVCAAGRFCIIFFYRRDGRNEGFMPDLTGWNRLISATADTPVPSSAELRHVRGVLMSLGRSCWFPLPQFPGNRRVWICAVIALTPLILVPASGQDGPPLGDRASVAAPAGSAAEASSAAAQKTAPAAKAGDEKAETSPKAQASAKAADPAAEPSENAGDPPKADAPKLTGVAAECADLLNLAKTLKTEVDKTTQDVLSVAVVRDANKIERMAHKMRDDRKH